jgi:cytochrome c oxidase assembly factor CtaG
VLNTGVFAFLTFSTMPVYAIYELAPPISVLSAREDQRLAGLLMKMGGAPILWTWVSILFFRWFGEDEMEETAATSPSARSVEQIPER